MEIIISTNGGHCHVERCETPCCPECEGLEWKFKEDGLWVSHDKTESFMVIVCQKCGKTLDLSLDME